MKKRIFAFLLVIVMIIGVLPMFAYAYETESSVSASADTVQEGECVAEVNGAQYATLLEAVNAAEAGQTITLLKDVEINDDLEAAPYTVYHMPEGSTLDLAGYTLTIRFARALFAGKDITITNGTITPPAANPADYPLYIGNAVSASAERIETSVTVENVTIAQGGICVMYGAELTVRDTTITVNPNRKYYAVYANAEAKVTIESGSYTGGRNNVDVRKADAATMTLYGGTYTNRPDESYLAEGHIIVENENGTYTVTAANYVAEVNGVQYTTLLEAVNAAEAGQTITLLGKSQE